MIIIPFLLFHHQSVMREFSGEVLYWLVCWCKSKQKYVNSLKGSFAKEWNISWNSISPIINCQKWDKNHSFTKFYPFQTNSHPYPRGSLWKKLLDIPDNWINSHPLGVVFSKIWKMTFNIAYLKIQKFCEKQFYRFQLMVEGNIYA